MRSASALTLRQRRVFGVTLIETLIALAVLVIITAVAVPGLSTMLGSSRAKTSARDLQSALELARSEAVRLTRTVSLCPSTNGTACTGGGSTNWRTGWILFDDVDGNGTLDSGTDGTGVLKVQPAMAATLTFTGPTSATFRSVGQAAAARSFSVTDSSQPSNVQYVCLLLSGASSVKTTAC